MTAVSAPARYSLSFSAVRDLLDAYDVELEGRNIDAVSVYLSDFEGVKNDFLDDLPCLLRAFDDHFAGCFSSYSDFVYDLVQDSVLCPRDADDLVARYFDYDYYGADLILGGDVSAVYIVGDDFSYVDARDIRRGEDPTQYFGRECFVFWRM